MTEKQYLEAVDKLLGEIYPLTQFYSDLAAIELQPINEETERRLAALKAQEDNMKSEMWEEKNPMVWDASIRKWRERNLADDKYAKDLLKEFGL